jgi:hypothetical protein
MEVPWPSRRADQDDDRPRRVRDDDEDDRPRRARDEDDADVRPVVRRRRWDRTCECPNCGYVGEPFERKEMAQEGWIILVVLLIVFFPLFFLGLLMKQTYDVCAECGYKIRKVGGITFG